MCSDHVLSPASRIKAAYNNYKRATMATRSSGDEVEPTTEEGFDRVNKTFRSPATGKLSYLGNCQALCTRCNSAKG